MASRPLLLLMLWTAPPPAIFTKGLFYRVYAFSGFRLNVCLYIWGLSGYQGYPRDIRKP